jgi:GR25 family glycosyltransferase involved in LPS biosynthesis
MTSYLGAQEFDSFLKYLPSRLGKTQSSFKNIDQTYVINLDLRYYKWERTRDQLEKYGIQATRVSGINGWKMDRELMKEIRKESLKWPCLSDGQLGCFLSHLAVLKDAFKRQYQCIWVLEDDIIPLEDLAELDELVAKMEVFDPEWDLLFTNINNRIEGRMDKAMLTFEMVMGPTFDYTLFKTPVFTPHENEDFRRIYCRLGTYSMIFSQRGIKKYLEYFEKEKIFFPIDMQLHCCPDRHVYISKKEYLMYDKKDSDTGYTSTLPTDKK